MNLEEKVRYAYWVNLGITNFEETEKIQEKLAQLRKENKIQDTILYTQHYPTITFGKSPKYNGFAEEFLNEVKNKFQDLNESIVLNYLNSLGIKFIVRNSGGGSAYTGIGQAIFYPIVDYEKIVNKTLGIQDYKSLIDEIMVSVLNEHYAIPAKSFKVTDYLHDLDNDESRKDRKDVWVEKNNSFYKIGSKAIHISNNIAYHGFSLFVKKESINGFDKVLPCGYKKDELNVTSMEHELDDEIEISQVSESVKSFIMDKFNYEEIIDVNLSELLQEEVEV